MAASNDREVTAWLSVCFITAGEPVKYVTRNDREQVDSARINMTQAPQPLLIDHTWNNDWDALLSLKRCCSMCRCNAADWNYWIRLTNKSIYYRNTHSQGFHHYIVNTWVNSDSYIDEEKADQCIATLQFKRLWFVPLARSLPQIWIISTYITYINTEGPSA